MTSIAFIAGTVPLVLSHGAGAEVRSVTGITVFAGMLGVTLFGLMARYEFNQHVAASVNVEHLTDKHYYSGVGGYNGYNYGTPRNVWMKVSYKF
ncbi:hypothetical protein G6F56_014610 [Rhizopus delemar]|nr:hypothetical protein G6F56_014610 [Rhizopus delemar]